MVKKEVNTILFLIFYLFFIIPNLSPQSQEDISFLIKNDSFKVAHISAASQSITKKYYPEFFRTGLSLLVNLYQSFISTQDENTCNFSISCSNFSRQAIEQYGMFYGVMISSDRLLRCSPICRLYYPIDPKSKLAVDYPVSRYFLGRAKGSDK